MVCAHGIIYLFLIFLPSLMYLGSLHILGPLTKIYFRISKDSFILPFDLFIIWVFHIREIVCSDLFYIVLWIQGAILFLWMTQMTLLLCSLLIELIWGSNLHLLEHLFLACSFSWIFLFPCSLTKVPCHSTHQGLFYKPASRFTDSLAMLISKFNINIYLLWILSTNSMD